MVYIALLRGINVSGRHKIKMTDLKLLVEKEGFTNVITYIQSGNIIFSSKISSGKTIEKKLEIAIQNYFNYSIEVFAISANQLKKIFISNSFLSNNNITIEKLYVTFLKKIPAKEAIKILDNIKQFTADDFLIINKTIFIHCVNGYGNTKLSNTFFEKNLKIAATTRNWKTITKLVELSSN